jgi:hypothetical protein
MTNCELVALVRQYDLGEITRGEFQAKVSYFAECLLLRIANILATTPNFDAAPPDQGSPSVGASVRARLPRTLGRVHTNKTKRP